MEIDLPAGRYVVAVSGGVDSVALLHFLAQKGQRAKGKGHASSALSPQPFTLVVAHYDHGIRPDSAKDRKLVAELAKKYGLPFNFGTGNLGVGASEVVARRARYNFLHDVRKASGAQAVITAHHQDDLLETAILNLLRGTGRRGLSSLKSTDTIKRPLLGIPKNELLRYANREGLKWREDSTNASDKYLRNYVRHHIMPRFAEKNREELLRIICRAGSLNGRIAVQTDNYLHLQPAAMSLDRAQFAMLPHAVAREIMAQWLLTHTEVELSRQLLERLVVAAKTGRSGTTADIDKTHVLSLQKQKLALTVRER